MKNWSRCGATSTVSIRATTLPATTSCASRRIPGHLAIWRCTAIQAGRFLPDVTQEVRNGVSHQPMPGATYKAVSALHKIQLVPYGVGYSLYLACGHPHL